jgi:hypothetical protein
MATTKKPPGWFMPPEWSRRLGYALSAPMFVRLEGDELFRNVFLHRVEHTDGFEELSPADQATLRAAEDELEERSGQPNPWANS